MAKIFTQAEIIRMKADLSSIDWNKVVDILLTKAKSIQAMKKKCYFCKQDCTEEYYSWIHEHLTTEIIICPTCYNVPLEPHGTLGNNMIKRGQGKIEKHIGNTIELIKQ